MPNQISIAHTHAERERIAVVLLPMIPNNFKNSELNPNSLFPAFLLEIEFMYAHFKWIHKFMSFGRVEIHMIYLEGQKKIYGQQ